MFIGYLSSFKMPRELAELIAITCNYKGIPFIYLTPNDIIVDQKTVRGRIYIQGKWKRATIPLPNFIDISPFCFSRLSKEQLEFLRENTTLTDTGKNRITKISLKKHLLEDKEFSGLVIPTKSIKNSEDVLEFVEKYKRVILKPSSGQFGIGIFSLESKNGDYLLKHGTEEKYSDYSSLIEFVEKEISQNKYVVQKYIDSFTKTGYPFDCRINVEKDGNGRWVIAKKFIRIGIGQKVVSNISRGGGVSETKPFLNANFENQQVEINKKLNHIGKTLPKKVEEIRGMNLVSLGIDLGISSTGRIYLFEVNSAPGTSQLKDTVALLRADYYEYVLKTI